MKNSTMKIMSPNKITLKEVFKKKKFNHKHKLSPYNSRNVKHHRAAHNEQYKS